MRKALHCGSKQQ